MDCWSYSLRKLHKSQNWVKYLLYKDFDLPWPVNWVLIPFPVDNLRHWPVISRCQKASEVRDVLLELIITVHTFLSIITYIMNKGKIKIVMIEIRISVNLLLFFLSLCQLSFIHLKIAECKINIQLTLRLESGDFL